MSIRRLASNDTVLTVAPTAALLSCEHRIENDYFLITSWEFLNNGGFLLSMLVRAPPRRMGARIEHCILLSLHRRAHAAARCVSVYRTVALAASTRGECRRRG